MAPDVARKRQRVANGDTTRISNVNALFPNGDDCIDLETLQQMTRSQMEQRDRQAKSIKRKKMWEEKARARSARLEQRRQQQAQLPIYQHKEALLQAIQERRVTIIAGSCGCGKSTQVPQYILDAHVLRGKRVNILVTQQRRLAATSIAARVAKERGTRLGGEVGFMIGGRTNYGPYTKLKFVTTGVLQQILLHQRTLKEYTHIIMDEVHERTTEIDIVAACVKQILRWNQHLRVVIMSATIDCSHFAQYFAGSFPRCAQVPSEVLEEWKADTEEELSESERLLQRLIDLLEPALDPGDPASHVTAFEGAMRSAASVPKALEEGLVPLGWSTTRYVFESPLDQSAVVDVMVLLRELYETVAEQRKAAVEEQAALPPEPSNAPTAAEEEDADLMVTRRPDPVQDPAPVINVTTVRPFRVMLCYLENAVQAVDVEPHRRMQILQPPQRPSLPEERKRFFFAFFGFLHHTKYADPEHTFLVFLPGSALIREFHTKLHTTFGAELDLHTLHSTVPIEDQQRVMLPSDPGRRKVILSTNIAESSITVPSVKVVLDFCLAKEVRWSAELHSPSLDDLWVSHSSAEQRAGRAGRVCDGEVYRWVTHQEYRRFPREQESQLRQQPLDMLVLRVLQMQWGDPDVLLARTIDPPDRSNVAASYQLLRDVGAVVCVGAPLDPVMANQPERVTEEVLTTFKSRFHVTKIGRVLAALKCDTLCGMLILYGSVFGVLEECLVMASIVTKGNPIMTSRTASKVSQARAFIHYAMESQSDLLAGLHAYRFWRRCAMRRVFPPEAEATWCEQHDLSLFHLREIEDSVVQFKEDLSAFHYCAAPSAKQKRRIRQHRRAVLPGTVDALLEAAAAEGGEADDDGDDGEPEDSATPAPTGPAPGKVEVREELIAAADDHLQGSSGDPAVMDTDQPMADGCPDPSDAVEEDGDEDVEAEDSATLLNPEDDLAKVLMQSGAVLEAKRAVGLDPAKDDTYRNQTVAESSDSEAGGAVEEEDSDASDMDFEGFGPPPAAAAAAAPRPRRPPVPRDVRLPDYHLRLLPMLIAAAFMAHMQTVRLDSRRPRQEEGWTDNERTSHMVEFTGFSRDLQAGDTNVVADALQQQQIARKSGKAASVPMDTVKRMTWVATGSIFAVFDSDRRPKQMKSKFCDRFPLSVRLAALSATQPGSARPGVLGWKTVRHHPHHAAVAEPLFHKKLKVRLDFKSVAHPLLLLSKDEDERDIVTLVPASMQGQRNNSLLDARHNTILYGAGKRELVFLVFHRALEVESYAEAGGHVKNLLRVHAPLRGELQEFYLQLEPALLQDIVALRHFINRSIMFPVDFHEDTSLLATDLDELEAELQRLTLQDGVAAFARAKLPTTAPGPTTLGRDQALERLLNLECECEAAQPGRFQKRWANPRIVVRHTVAAQSSLHLNQRLVQSHLERSIYENPDLLTPKEMEP